MSDSLMDRLLIDASLEGGGPLSRSLSDAGTEGIIDDHAPHWAIESFIPMHASTLIDYLIQRDELDHTNQAALRRFVFDTEKILNEQTGSYHTRFTNLYVSLDPDPDCHTPRLKNASTDHQSANHQGGNHQPAVVHDESPSPTSTRPQQPTRGDGTVRCADDAVEFLTDRLDAAGYRRLSEDDIQQCINTSSQWSVPIRVDFDAFEQLIVYARGDIIGLRTRRRLRKLYRRETVTVPIYQRMMVVFQLRDEDPTDEDLATEALHLRMFKNIPKQDVDMLVPGARVRISGVDHAKIILPSLGGFLMSLRKIAHIAILFAALTLHWVAILIGLLIGYFVKGVLSYFQTKNKYQLNLTRNLYFQKLDCNAGAAHRLIQQAHRQTTVELLLAYYAILVGEQPVSTRRLRRRCQRIVREAIDVEVDFRIDRALQGLLEYGFIRGQGDKWWAK